MIVLTLTNGRQIPLTERWTASLLARIAPPDAHGHARWTGRVDRDGYPVIGIRPAGQTKANLQAHRAVFAVQAGRSPLADHDVDHACFDRLCMAHLRELPAPANRGRHAADLEPVCPNGHARTPANTYTTAAGTSHCQPCRRAAHVRWLARQAGDRAV